MVIENVLQNSARTRGAFSAQFWSEIMQAEKYIFIFKSQLRQFILEKNTRTKNAEEKGKHRIYKS